MAKINPGNIETVEATVDTATTALVVGGGEGRAVSARPSLEIGQYSGPRVSLKDMSDRLKIVYDVSNNKPEAVPPGAFVIGKNYDFAFVCNGKCEPFRAFLMSSGEYLKERTDGSAGQIPRTYLTKEDALAAGHSLEWVNDPATGRGIGPSVSPAVDLLMLVEKPTFKSDYVTDTGRDMFRWRLGGKDYALVVFTADKGLYKDVSQALSTIKQSEASSRGVNVTLGNPGAYLLEFIGTTKTSTPKPPAVGRKVRTCIVRIATEVVDGEPSRIGRSEEFSTDLASVLGSVDAPLDPSNDDQA